MAAAIETPLSHLGFQKAVFIPSHPRSSFTEWDDQNLRYKPVVAYKTSKGAKLVFEDTVINVPESNISYWIPSV